MRTPLRQLSLCAAALLIAALPVSAQEPTTLTGTVTTTGGAPVETGSVFIGSLSLGVLTNAQGRYVLIVPANARAASATVDVTASLIGYTTVTQTVTLQPGTQVLDFVLGEDPLRIAGVTVTALGMERQSRELGISTQQVSGSELTRVEPNIVNSLTGKIAGVNITNSGSQGGSSRIVIRGEASITGENQPLFIVDGIPVDNTIGGRVGTLTDQGGVDYGNPIADINPDDIESVTVLKGPNAAALYGSRASNGAIIIETKKGRNTPGGSEIVVSQQVTFESILKLPDYQNTYGGGYNGQYSFYDGLGNGVNDEADESWGPPLDTGLCIPQWFSTYDALTDTRACDPWVSHPDNVRNFFDTGVTSTTNVSVAGSTESLNGRASFSRQHVDGMQPGNYFDRMAFSFAGGINGFDDRLNVSASAQYINATGNNRPGIGYGEEQNLMYGFIWWNRNIDMGQLKDYWQQDRPADEPNIGGFPYSWTTLYWTNPYFRALAHRNEDGRDRLIGQVSASFQFTPWLTAMVRTGTDWYQDSRLKTFAANPQIAISGGHTTNPLTAGREYLDAGGSFGTWGIGSQETNTDFLVTASPELNLPFTTTLTVGGNRRDNERKNDYTWVGALSSPGIWDVSNAASVPERTQLISRKRINSLYGQLDLGYNDYLFLTFTGRNDWSSTLPEANRSYFYPSVSTSLVFSELMDMESNLFSYGKIRASWAQVGNDTDPYRLRNTYAADEIWNGIPSFSVPARLENPDLKPEITESLEFGAELGFLDNRLGLDVTYYTAQTKDQLMPVQLSPATGYGSRMLNAGTVENKGWEVLVRGTPVATSDFRWESTVTWSKNDNKVKKLAPGVSGLQMTLGDFWGAQLFAREGEPLGQIVGSDFRREDLDGDGTCGEPDPGSYVDDPNGRVVVSATGGYPLWCDGVVIGNVNPDWRGGWLNEFSYKGVRLGVLFDARKGGQIYSMSDGWLRYAGQVEETVAGRCGGGYPACDATTGIVVDGVNETSPGVYVPNTTVIDGETFWFIQSYYIEKSDLEPAGYLKLREATLSFSLPESWTGRWGVDGVDLSLVGRNLFLWSDAKHIDPETSFEGTNVQGFEFGQMPSARSYGINVTVRP